MGVPKFFRWVTDRYPSILSGPISGPPSTSNVDNLYLDMNGLIHECSHTDADLSEDLPFTVIVENIFNEIRRIFNIVQPTRVLYIAVDGVAPRAKLNQQRARRFRSSRDRLKALQDTGASSSFDSNCITPGTEFMTNLSIALRAFIEHMLRTDPLWTHLKVHFSGAEVPGEGEHKIVSFIRESRVLIDYQPNTRHCILGADADMIMLSLATHEPYFLVLRDLLSFNHRGPPRSQNSAPVVASSAVTTYSHQNGTGSTAACTSAAPVNSNRQRRGGKVMNYVRINVLRECIVAELLEDLNHADFDHERVIDDFVFLTFLVGNDFLPHLPAINIGDDAFDIIFDAYKTVLASDPGYLVCEGQLDVARMELIFALIGVTEMSLFHDQKVMQELKDKQAAERREKYAVLRAQRAAAIAEAAAAADNGSVCSAESGTSSVPAAIASVAAVSQLDVADAEAAMPDANSSDVIFTEPGGVSVMDRQEELKKEYYTTKFGIDIDTPSGQTALREIIGAYLVGLQWCLQYYSCGCTSWTWYYPYHYGPFLHDLTGLTSLPAYSTVPLGRPLKPFQQLLACLPAASAQLLPASYNFLMNDAASPIRWFYPTDFSTDKNGKKQEYESTVLLPFIDIDQLVAAEAQYCAVSSLTEAERARNQFGMSAVYTLRNHSTSISLTEREFSTTPARAFAAELIPGTVPPAISIAGFPSKAALMEVVNYTKGYGKSKAAKKNQRTRTNCYGEEGGAGETQEAFPMPGQVSRDVTGDRALSDGCDSKMSAPAVKPVLSRASTAGTSTSSHVEVNSTGETVALRLVLDPQTTAFLQAVAAQIGQQNPFFHPQESGASERGLVPLYVNMSLTEQFGLSSVAAHQQVLQESEILPSAGAIFGPVRGTLQPVGVLTMDNSVKVKFVDTSHLGQLEEFLCQRLLGNELLDSLTRSQQGAGVDNGAVNSVHNASKPVVDSGVGFSRFVVIGSYVGRDSERFVSWLNKELYKLASYLPVFTCERLEYVVESGEGVEDVRRSVSLTG